MAKAAKIKDSGELARVAGNIFSGITTVFTFMILTIFPLYYQNYYFDILKAKYKFYWVAAIAMLAACAAVALVFCFVDGMEFRAQNIRRFLGNFRRENLKKQPFVYKALFAFWLFAALSTVLSDYRYESFWGNEGRFSGLFLITLYVLSVAVIGKLGRIQKWHLDLFLAAGMLVCLFGLTDYFQMDLLGWKVNVDKGQANSFTSTLGNINTYTAFVALMMGTACSLFATEKNVLRMLWYYAAAIMSFIAIITGQSDNAYLALGVLFGGLPFILFADARWTARYGVLVASFLTVIKVIADVNEKMAGKVIGLSGIFSFLAKYERLEVIVIAFWGVAAVLYIGRCIWIASRGDAHIGKWLRLMWLFLVAVVAAVLIYIVYDANFGDQQEKYQALSRYLIFNDNWGTNRGYCWRIGWESYKKLPPIHKLFGFGADTYGILTWDFRQEAIGLHGVFYESAHNEYLQYLVTIGPFALIFYVLFLGGACWRMLKGMRAKPWVLGPCMAVLCYGAQAAVNINLPIATPVMWCLLAVGLSMERMAAAETAGADQTGAEEGERAEQAGSAKKPEQGGLAKKRHMEQSAKQADSTEADSQAESAKQADSTGTDSQAESAKQADSTGTDSQAESAKQADSTGTDGQAQSAGQTEQSASVDTDDKRFGGG